MHAAVFIDGGYLSRLLRDHFGRPSLDYHQFASWAASPHDLFRAYYYDCPVYQSNPPLDDERRRYADQQRFFRALERGPRFMLRLGRLEKRGTKEDGSPLFVQKRVDLQLGLDIASLVMQDRVGVIAIVSGDSDMIPAVQMARDNGIIVRLIYGPVGTYHADLWAGVDERMEITDDIIRTLLLNGA